MGADAKPDECEKFVFEFIEDTEKCSSEPNKKGKNKNIWKIIPAICASTMCLPFGLMLGWPSPIYPRIIQTISDPQHSITPDQSAMIAGFLMIGNSIATPFSSHRKIGPKYGIIAGVIPMLAGWIIMWLAPQYDYFLLALLSSRLLVGLGHGYGMGQLRIYIGEICQPDEDLHQRLMKMVNLMVMLGIILSFAAGPWVEFTKFGMIGIITSVLVLFLVIFLPSTPEKLVRSAAGRLIVFLNSPDYCDRSEKSGDSPRELGFLDLFRDRRLCENFAIFAFLVFFQQFTGAPSTIVYSQIMFEKSHSGNKSYVCAFVYSLVFFATSCYVLTSSRYSTKCLRPKLLLLVSSVGTTLVTVAKIIILVDYGSSSSNWIASLVAMFFYIVIHTIGLGNVPLLLVPYLFPKSARKVVTHFFIIYFSLLALIITKITQVIMYRVNLAAAFVLFLVISTFSVVFILVFVKNKYQVYNEDKNIATNL